MEALSSVMWKNALPNTKEECPGDDELSLFVRGKVNEQRREQLVAHLSICDRCIGFLKRKRQRRSLVREASLVFAAVTALLLAIVWGLRTPVQISPKTETVDLRPFSLTRGGETVTAAGETPAISGKTSRLRLLLPPGSEGPYECEILGDRKGTALIHAGAEASVREGQVILEFAVPSAHIPAGQYTLALRKQGADWVYYPVLMK